MSPCETPFLMRLLKSDLRRMLPALAGVVLLAGTLLPAAALEQEVQLEITAFELRLTDTLGLMSHRVTGERLLQMETQGLQQAEAPRLEIFTDGTIDWIWTAPVAIHFPLQHRWLLTGATRGTRLPGADYPWTQISGEDITIETELREIFSPGRATLTQPGLTITGVGLHADLNKDIIRLHNQVYTVYAQDMKEQEP